MKKKKFAGILVLIWIVIPMLFINDDTDTISTNRIGDFEPEFNYPSEWYDYQRTYPYGKLDQTNYLKTMKELKEFQKRSTFEPEWQFAGPTNIGGRISDIEIHPNTPTTIYVGAASGGIFKSTDNGANWINIFGFVPTIGIGDMAIDPNNEQVIYAGTGEANASSNTFLGSGIYKTTDGGTTWNYTGLENSAYIGRIIVDWNNSSRIYAAACGNLFTQTPDRGIYRSIDAGETWNKILFLTDSTSGIDLVQHPTNPEILYAAMWERIRGLDYRRSFGTSSGIYKSTNGGDTWTELTIGLPTGNTVGRIGISISESNPNILYAIYDKSDYVSQVFKTVDGGSTWTQTNDGILSNINSSFGWYFGQIRIDPQNENKVYALGQYFYDTGDAGSSWMESGTEMHVDHHAMEFTNGRIWEGNDGGLYYSTNNGSSWIKVNTLPLTQFYDIALDSSNVNRLYGGTQDNNSIRTTTGNINDWEYLLGGDGMHCLVDYTNPNIFYCESQFGGVYRIENNNYYWIGVDADRTNWSTPYVLHPTDPNILYLGTYRVKKTTNKGNSWTPISTDLTKGGTDYFHTLTTIDISALNTEIIMTGSGDGKVYITTNDGAQWTDISEGLPDRWITNVKTDPFDEYTVYATLSGFRWDEHYSHVFKSSDLGQTWTAIDGNLPEIPVNVLVLDPDKEGRIYIGTDAGIYMTDDSGNNWEFISGTLPNVPVLAMEFQRATRTLFVGTYGLSAYKAYIPLEIVGVEEPNASERVIVYPNPVSSGDKLNIRIEGIGQKIIEYSVTDSSGKEIYRNLIVVKPGNSIFTWNVMNASGRKLTSGIYVLNYTIDQKTYCKKIKVQ
jgi:photosystem II stability/assembly factor-like uncharacterized protein